MPLPPDSVGKGIVFRLSHLSTVCLFDRSFVWSDIVTTISHEQLLHFW